MPIADVLLLSNVFFAFGQSNIAGKVIVAMLMAGSVIVWSVMLTKHSQLRDAYLSTQRFIKAYRKESHPAGLYLKRQTFKLSPLSRIYVSCCEELGSNLEAAGSNPDDLLLGAVGEDRLRLGDRQLSAVRGVIERELADEALALDQYMGLLATATTTAPFLGLLGTVWGVMDAFGGMAVKGSALLSEVAPGISGALITTVIGLVVALPSAIGYNFLSERIRKINVISHNFAQELVNDVECHYAVNQ